MRQLSRILFALLALGACGVESRQPEQASSDPTPSISESASSDLERYRDRARSDDAETIEEAFFHGQARALVIRNLELNELQIGGAEFRVKRNPVGEGAFVYDPRTRFEGVERNLVQFVPNETTAYALNAPSKLVTPGLKWPREDGVDVPSTDAVVAYVFDGERLPEPVDEPQPVEASFTVAEYRVYQAIIGAPMSISETEAVTAAAEAHGVSEAEAKSTAGKVQRILFKNNWFGDPSSEIRHASDWSGEGP